MESGLGSRNRWTPGQRRNDDQLAKPDLNARLRTLYSGWNRRIEQETETKLKEIERRSGVRSSLEVIGMALLIPDSTQQ